MVSNSFTGMSDTALLASMALGDERACTELYNRYWKMVTGYAYNRLRDKEQSREIVQDIFMSLWERRAHVKIVSLRDYLFRAVKYSIIDTINEQKRREAFTDKFYALSLAGKFDNVLAEQHSLEHLKAQIENSLSHLPEYYGQAFKLSRLEHLTSAEIAKRMNISVRTADNYVTHALKHLRGSLGEMMVVVWLVMTGW